MKRVPEEYAACFGMLGDAGLIPPALAERLKQMARFRNLLVHVYCVHVYWKMAYGRLYDVISGDLEDLREFAGAITRLL